MQKYRSHKVVEAGKILGFKSDQSTSPPTMGVVIQGQSEPEMVPMHWHTNKNEGSDDDLGYLVRYEDGYLSWSPSKPFEEGYTLMETKHDSSEAGVEAAIQAAGKTAPRLTPADIDAAIAAEDYYVFPGTTVTVCCLTLHNGFNTIGYSAAASPENFDEQIGRDISRRNAREEIWALEGYRLKQFLHDHPVVVVDPALSASPNIVHQHSNIKGS